MKHDITDTHLEEITSEKLHGNSLVTKMETQPLGNEKEEPAVSSNYLSNYL